MVAIRMTRRGGTNDPIYSVVVMDSMKKRDGAYLEHLGQYLPKAKDAKSKLTINMDAYNAWIKKGAKASETVRQLIKGLSK